MYLNSFLIVSGLCPLLILFSKQFKVYDVPDSRKSHIRPTCKLGGLAIFIAFFVSSYLHKAIDYPLLLSSFILIGIALADDKYELNKRFRFCCQAACALRWCIWARRSVKATQGLR